MGLFKKLKRLTKGVLKVAVKTAPIWSNFIPGGSIAEKVVTRVGSVLDKGKQIRTRLRGLGATSSMLPGKFAKFGDRARSLSVSLGGPRIHEQATRSQDEQMAYAVQGTHHAGIRGPVAQRYGPMHNHLRAMRSPGYTTRRRRRPTGLRKRRRTVGRMTRRRRRAA